MSNLHDLPTKILRSIFPQMYDSTLSIFNNNAEIMCFSKCPEAY